MSVAVKLDEKYTYADYLKWPDNERWELIEGIPYDMSPAPNINHQTISGEIFVKIHNEVKKNGCRVFSAPFDVRLIENIKLNDDETETVVQPDISVICDKSKLEKRGCVGAPDIAIEILSQSTAYKDETEKLKLYEKHGVKEYWIVNPDANYIMIYRLENDIYGKPEYLEKNDILKSQVLKDFKLDLSKIWEI